MEALCLWNLYSLKFWAFSSCSIICSAIRTHSTAAKSITLLSQDNLIVCKCIFLPVVPGIMLSLEVMICSYLIQFKLAHIGFTLNIYPHGTNMAYLQIVQARLDQWFLQARLAQQCNGMPTVDSWLLEEVVRWLTGGCLLPASMLSHPYISMSLLEMLNFKSGIKPQLRSDVVGKYSMALSRSTYPAFLFGLCVGRENSP